MTYDAPGAFWFVSFRRCVSCFDMTAFSFLRLPDRWAMAARDDDVVRRSKRARRRRRHRRSSVPCRAVEGLNACVRASVAGRPPLSAQLVASVARGASAAVLAYGQTGSGKVVHLFVTTCRVRISSLNHSM